MLQRAGPSDGVEDVVQHCAVDLDVARLCVLPGPRAEEEMGHREVANRGVDRVGVQDVDRDARDTFAALSRAA